MKDKNVLISAIVPCFNESEALPFFYEEATRVFATMEDVDAEMIFIDDGSSDGTLDILRSLAEKDDRVRYISFSRNFGKESAMYAGLKASKGDFVAIMDADLQDPPSLLPEMLRIIREEGYDSVATRRSTRKGEPPIRTMFAHMFYGIMNKMSSVRLVQGARDFRLMCRKMCDALISMGEYNRFTKGMFEWVGFKTKWLSYENIQRVAGTTKWSFFKLFKYAIECIVSFSTSLLSLPLVLGAAVSLLSLAGIIIFACLANATAAWACVVTLVGGFILISTGILGMYLSRSYLEVKKRPLYIVRETEKDK